MSWRRQGSLSYHYADLCQSLSCFQSSSFDAECVCTFYLGSQGTDALHLVCPFLCVCQRACCSPAYALCVMCAQGFSSFCHHCNSCNNSRRRNPCRGAWLAVRVSLRLGDQSRGQ